MNTFTRLKKTIFFFALSIAILSQPSCNEAATESEQMPTVDTAVHFAPKTNSLEQKNIPDGPYEERHPNGLIKLKGEYTNGKRHGVWLSFYPDGKIWSEGTYKNGVREGIAKTFHPNGNKNYEGFYTDGEESGKWSFYDESGKLIKEIDYNKTE